MIATNATSLRDRAQRLVPTVPVWMRGVIIAAASCTEDEAGHRLGRWGRDWIRDDLRDVRALSVRDVLDMRAKIRDPHAKIPDPDACLLALSMLYRSTVRRSETIRIHRSRFAQEAAR